MTHVTCSNKNWFQKLKDNLFPSPPPTIKVITTN